MPKTTSRMLKSKNMAPKGLSLSELLVAIAISSIFMVSIVTAYVQITQSANVAEARIRAHTRARAGLEAITRDVRRVATDLTLSPNPQDFVLTTNTLTYGDHIDSDGDGPFDEETLDGLDNDSDWSVTDDNHIVLGGLAIPDDREGYVGVADLGDDRVDEDLLFSHDTLRIRIPASVPDPAFVITYRIDTFDGQDHVLVREVIEDPDGTPTTTIEPVVFDVVSLDILAWNANDDAPSPLGVGVRPYWQDAWNATNYNTAPPSPIGTSNAPYPFPAALFIQITTNAEGVPLSEIGDWPIGNRELKTTKLSTIVTIEEIIKSVDYMTATRIP